MLCNERIDSFWLQQGNIAVGHHHGAVEVRDCAQAALHRVAGAVLLLLHCLQDLDVHLFSDRINCGADLVALVAHHGHDVRRLDGSGRVQRVRQQAAPADLVQRLLLRRLHPGTSAGRENDDGALRVVGHA